VWSVFLAVGNLSAAFPVAEFAATGIGALGLGVSEIYKEKLIPDEARWKNPPEIDSGIRSGLLWSNPNAAHTLSNIMVLGVIIPAGILTPLASNHDYGRSLLTISEAALATGVITQIVKFSVARERPYSYYNAQSSRGSYDRVSFFSGHTSYAFSISLSTAMLLAESYPQHKILIYGLALSVASFTGYLRIAADHHYFTDVLVGAIVGSAISYGVVQMQLNSNSTIVNDERRLAFQKTWILF